MIFLSCPSTWHLWATQAFIALPDLPGSAQSPRLCPVSRCPCAVFAMIINMTAPSAWGLNRSKMKFLFVHISKKKIINTK